MLLRPVMLAHLLTKGFKIERSAAYKDIVVPMGGSEATPMFYDYIKVYLAKIVGDLKRLALWDCSG